MSNSFKWYLYISIDGGPWARCRGYVDNIRGKEAAERAVRRWENYKGLKAKVIREGKEEGA